jgi:hypothetical protein
MKAIVTEAAIYWCLVLSSEVSIAGEKNIWSTSRVTKRAGLVTESLTETE